MSILEEMATELNSILIHAAMHVVNRILSQLLLHEEILSQRVRYLLYIMHFANSDPISFIGD